MVLPMTVLGAVPDYKDVPKDHWAYDSIMSLTEKGMVEGKVAGVRFDPEDNLRTTELFMTLYRLAGEPEVVPSFDFRGNFSDEDIISGKYEIELAGDDKYGTSHLRGKWYRDAAFWAAYNGIALVFADPPGNCTNKIEGPYRVGNVSYSLPEVGKAFNDEDSYCIGIDLGFDYTTRSEIVVALYLYVIEYLKKEVEIENTVEAFADSDKIPALEVDQDGNATNAGETYIALPLYYNMYSMGEGHIWADAWNWAVGAGIIEGYPDNTLRPAAELTRAEFAEILERFIDYVK